MNRPRHGGRILMVAVLAYVVAASSRSDVAAQGTALTTVRRYEMGTSIEVRAWGGDPATRTTAIEEAFAAFAEVDRMMSNYRDDSELAEVNRDAARAPVHISEPLFRVIQAAELVSRQSDGAFDITVGPLVRLWGFHDHKAHAPSSQELDVVRPLVNFHNVVLDEAARTIRFVRPGVELDLGGIGKGFAVELAAAALRARGLSGFIDAGGNQYLLGQPLGKSTWTIGIRDPDQADGLLGTITVPEGSVSTSATYANFLTLNGRTYGHILDPHTLMPSDASLSVTIWSPDGTLADALSKAAFVLGRERGLAIIDSMPRTMGVIAYRDADGHVATIMSAGLRGAFHTIARHDR
jgi:FAD:protein FMN transferase